MIDITNNERALAYCMIPFVRLETIFATRTCIIGILDLKYRGICTYPNTNPTFSTVE